MKAQEKMILMLEAGYRIERYIGIVRIVEKDFGFDIIIAGMGHCR